jgi:hypothetical protein
MAIVDEMRSPCEIGGTWAGSVHHPQWQNRVEVIHKLLQAHPILSIPVKVWRILGKCDAQAEQARSKNAIIRVVVQLAPLLRRRQFSPLKADRINDAVTRCKFLWKFGAGDATSVQSLWINPVNVFSGRGCGPALEAGVVEQSPVVQINRVFERTALEIDHPANGLVQEIRQRGHRRVRRTEHRDRGAFQQPFRELPWVQGDL